MKNFLTIFLASNLFISCKKTNAIVETNYLTGTYITSNNFIADLSIMYTKNSIITNQQLIQNYLSRHSPYSFTAAATSIPFNDTIKIDFLSTSNAKVSFLYANPLSSYIFNTSVFETSSTNILLKAIDTTYKYFGLDYCSINNDSYYKNNGKLNCSTFNGGNNTTCIYKREFPIEIANNSLRLPHFFIAQNRSVVGPFGLIECFITTHNNYSYFNESPLTQLQNTDTVVVKKMYLNLVHL